MLVDQLACREVASEGAAGHEGALERAGLIAVTHPVDFPTFRVDLRHHGNAPQVESTRQVANGPACWQCLSEISAESFLGDACATR